MTREDYYKDESFWGLLCRVDFRKEGTKWGIIILLTGWVVSMPRPILKKSNPLITI